MSESLTVNTQVPQNVTKNVTSIKTENFSFIWSINQFGKFLNRKYEFSSPIFSPKTLGTSKWKLVVFPENVYPQGVQVVLRLQKVSADDQCSVIYTILLTDNNGKDSELQTREKVFRHYLDYDECPVASNQEIKDKHLQNDSTLTICCKIDMLLCENLDDTVSDPLKSCESTNFPVTNDFSCLNNYQKSIQCERTNNLSTKNNFSSTNPSEMSTEWEDIINGSPYEGVNFLQTSRIKMENTQNSKENYKRSTSPKISADESDKQPTDLSEKIDSFIHKTRGRGKPTNESKNSKNLEILSSDLNFLYTTKYQHDVTIYIDNGRIRAHKAILAARSDYFRRILMPGDTEIHIDGINIKTTDAVLYYMYTGQKPQMTFDDAMDILTACNMFHLDHLGNMAQDTLRSRINTNNVTDILCKSKELQLENLKIFALKFVGKNHEAVTKTLKWNQMITSDPHAAGEILLTIASFQNKSSNRY